MTIVNIKEIVTVVTMYTIVIPLSIRRLFLEACRAISSAWLFNCRDVEVKKPVASELPFTPPKVVLISVMAPVVP